MATRFIERSASETIKGDYGANVAAIHVDSDDEQLKFYDRTNDTVLDVVTESQTQTLTNKTLTSPTISGTVTDSSVKNGPAPVTSAANLSLTAALHAGKTVVVNKADGWTGTLPAATGTGNKYRIVVGTTLTSGSLVVAVASASDFMLGRAIISNDTDGSASNFETANTGTGTTESDTITFNRTTTGLGTRGDEIELEDFATNMWSVTVRAVASGIEATPFSAAV